MAGKGKGKGLRKGGKGGCGDEKREGEVGETGDGRAKRDGEGKKEASEQTLPPMRTFECLAEPRAALAQRLQAQEARTEQLREGGGGGKATGAC